jgi:tRNA(fMet)-specific endonuclease VapC
VKAASMLVLDSDHMSLLEWGTDESATLRERLADIPLDEVAVTIIGYEEQMRGWMAYVARAKSIEQQLAAYRRLRRHLENYREVRLLDFDEAAAEEFQRLRREKIRIGTMDLKIAATVLSRDATLLSRNVADFRQVPNLKVEDWTQ